MHASIRTYPENAELAEQLAARGDEIKAVVADVAGFHAYYLVRTEDVTVSITVCDDQGGVQDSNELAAAWLLQNVPDQAEARPKLVQGRVLITSLNDAAHG
jgi:hypothetical protein